ncbi:MAG: (2Fe-2S) ferredoxin domain-containing protein, partial [Planctomycetota bacterium]|nr:(2Fe-2S) ferredoxin domain-containing protein [Planctomycetota bacterium]
MKSISDHCCDKCTHSADTPCPDFVQCLTEGPLCHESDKCRSEKERLLQEALYAGATSPVLFAGAGTCGMAAGCAEVVNSLNKALENDEREIKIVEVGCIGFCAMEPLIDIQYPGHKRVLASELTGEDAQDV